MTKLEAALLDAIGLQPGIVTGMSLDFSPNESPVLYVELVLPPSTMDGLPETVINRFNLVEIHDDETAA